MAQSKWRPADLGVEMIVDGTVYRAVPMPRAWKKADRYAALVNERIVGQAETLAGAQALCERAAAQRVSWLSGGPK